MIAHRTDEQKSSAVLETLTARRPPPFSFHSGSTIPQTLAIVPTGCDVLMANLYGG